VLAELFTQVGPERLEITALVSPGRHRPRRRQQVRGDPRTGEMAAQLLERVVAAARPQIRQREADLAGELIGAGRRRVHRAHGRRSRGRTPARHTPRVEARRYANMCSYMTSQGSPYMRFQRGAGRRRTVHGARGGSRAASHRRRRGRGHAPADPVAPARRLRACRGAVDRQGLRGTSPHRSRRRRGRRRRA
jgi:hypothetical protein